MRNAISLLALAVFLTGCTNLPFPGRHVDTSPCVHVPCSGPQPSDPNATANATANALADLGSPVPRYFTPEGRGCYGCAFVAYHNETITNTSTRERLCWTPAESTTSFYANNSWPTELVHHTDTIMTRGGEDPRAALDAQNEHDSHYVTLPKEAPVYINESTENLSAPIVTLAYNTSRVELVGWTNSTYANGMFTSDKHWNMTLDARLLNVTIILPANVSTVAPCGAQPQVWGWYQ